MATLLELAQLSSAIYNASPSVDGWALDAHQRAGGNIWNGLEAAAFRRGNERVIAFRGTTIGATDIIADLKLGVGMNNDHFGAAGDFIESQIGSGPVVVTGHSLGGAIAQVVANRYSLMMATFNAPGVAVLASRNIGTSTTLGFAARLGGSLVSAIRHPVQAAQDVRSTFNVVQGVNLCLANDIVSQIGVHYGKVKRIPGTSMNPLTEHGIETVVSVLRTAPEGRLTPDGC